MRIVANTALQAVDRPNDDRWNATCSCQKRKEVVFSGHYVIASSRPPERRPLERRTLAPMDGISHKEGGTERMCEETEEPN